MTTPQREEFLSDLHVAVISVAATDGRPPASYPIWYDYVPGGDIRIKTSHGSRKARLIEAAGALTLTVQTEEPPYKYVVVECSLATTVKPASVQAQEELAIRYLGDEAGRAFVANIDDPEPVIYLLHPQRWITADFSGEL